MQTKVSAVNSHSDEIPIRLLQTSENANMLAVEWRFVFVQAGLLFLLVRFQNVGVGLLTASIFFLFWKRRFDYREAVVALFIVACVLASSREPGLQYWKNLRLLPAALLFVDALKSLRFVEARARSAIIRWIVFVASLTATPALVSEDLTQGLFESLLLTSMWFAMLALARPKSAKESLKRFTSLKHLVIVVVLASLVFFIGDGGLGFLNGRFRGIFGNPNEMSHWVFPFALLVVFSGNLTRTKDRLWAVSGVIGLLLVTGTRGALVALFLGLVAFLTVDSKVTPFRLWGGILVAFVLIVSQNFIIEQSQRFLPERLVRLESLGEGGGRFLAWEYAIEEIKKRPVFGGGGGYEERYFGENYSFFAMQNHQGLSHNSWLAFAMNFGVANAILLILGLFRQLGLLNGMALFFAAPAFLFSLTFEGWLTAPMSASTPILFFVGGWLGSHLSRSGY